MGSWDSFAPGSGTSPPFASAAGVPSEANHPGAISAGIPGRDKPGRAIENFQLEFGHLNSPLSVRVCNLPRTKRTVRWAPGNCRW